jgi:peptidoglycan/LPS O-acetylase OafA/YrhL
LTNQPVSASPRSLSIPDQVVRRPALDGLRGLAVLAVMFYHYNGHWLQGGFLGVDVFFVLSGYLITSLLLVDYERTGSVVSARFWIRRVRRLLPALLIMLLLLSLYYAIVVPTSDVGRIKGGAFATLLFVKNYWDAFSAPGTKWPTHAWSLAVEEQFYLVWPVALWWMLRRTARRSAPLLGTLVALIAASAVLRLAWSFHNATYANEALETRASTLLVGAALAICLMTFKPRSTGSTRALIDLTGIVSLVLLITAMQTTRISHYAWLWYGGGVLIAMAAGAVILAAVHGDGIVQRALSIPVLRAIGLISYGLYLYHLIVFMWITPERYSVNGSMLFLLRFGISFALATASYLLVEMPVRRGRLGGLPTRAVVVVAPLVTAAVILASTQLAAPALPAGVTQAMRANWTRAANGGPAGAPRVLVAGDAFAYSLTSSPPPAVASRIGGTKAAVVTCGIASGTLVIGEARFSSQGCDVWTGIYSTAVKDYVPNVAVLMIGVGEIFDRIVGNQLLRAGTPELESYLVQRLDAARAVLSRGGARLIVAAPPCMRTMKPDMSLPAFASVFSDARRGSWLNALLRHYASQTGAGFVDLRALLCQGGTRVDPSATPTAFSGAESSRVWTAIARAVLR